ncbi:TetR/AcrR family transcriptional regulator [Candidatus Desantisbacteria bacterium]|nr:TetR/AcrR family transcriptional regulator [Candidatus Desantisbacteria bacterium]
MTRIVKKPDKRRQEIIAAAREIFQKKDYKSTTMQDIMDTLGIAKGTIYHYFKSKEDLLEAIISNTVDQYIAKLKKVLDETEGSGLDKMRALIISGNVEQQHKEILEHLHHPSNIGLHTRQLAVTLLRLAPLHATAIQQGCEEGIFKTEHPLESAEFLLAGIQFLTDTGFYPWRNEDLMRRAMAIPSLIEAQLNAPKGSFNFLVGQ